MKLFKLINIVLLSFITAFICISCEKLVEVEIPNNQITTDLVFQDAQTANAVLAGLYAGVRDNSLLAGDKMGPHLGVYTDDLDSYSPTATNGIYELYQNQQTDINALIYSNWTSTYQQIFIANAILEGVQASASLSTSERTRLKGEALFLRSLLFFYLQQLFGDIPYPLSTDYKINTTLPKTPAFDVLQKLDSDLQESISLMNDAYNNPERIFANKKTAQLLLAKVYMTQNRWSEAEIVLNNIVQSPLYSFENDLSKVFLKSGSHILWQLKPKNPGDATKEASIYYFTGAVANNYALTADLVAAFSTTDQRKQKWIATVTVGPDTWYRTDKYKNRLANTTEYSIVFRLEEVYLLLSEALAKQNKIAQALPYLNATRQRAGINPIISPVSQSTLLNEILQEDRREFFTEMGHRFFDLKRTGQLQVLTAVKTHWQTYHELWPLPQKELQLNPNLNPQNTGY
ncbi:RagB/SusD family nutrient uptake outer membrane protein [Pedobacter sp. ISL-68]|uniref:RagB/SusD family nutrient uptake outer membrane protein n=1 Tax=unclassified Pedobacter TaxID=2628915 RepID=UPI001BE59B43|nr:MULTISPECIES: RagB/SusD family nutrient uptake outer membrane protein [unclassified Pedobacter]MBT2559835.1 RagB/SusD family nutrient uptake outer membrane protein [Pedobacter sp. ISL-64]MBT2592140.1 RagB/SusD family nutrient uptake outer membrane protein [Pedobacter sp. ISL-68]